VANLRKPKTAIQAEMQPWLSANPQFREKRFIQVGTSLFHSKRFQQLSIGARYMLFCMAMDAGKSLIFEFPKSSGRRYGFAYSSYTRYLKEMIQKKFLVVKQSGRSNFHKNVYSFSTDWKIRINPDEEI